MSSMLRPLPITVVLLQSSCILGAKGGLRRGLKTPPTIMLNIDRCPTPLCAVNPCEDPFTAGADKCTGDTPICNTKTTYFDFEGKECPGCKMFDGCSPLIKPTPEKPAPEVATSSTSAPSAESVHSTKVPPASTSTTEKHAALAFMLNDDCPIQSCENPCQYETGGPKCTGAKPFCKTVPGYFYDGEKKCPGCERFDGCSESPLVPTPEQPSPKVASGSTPMPPAETEHLCKGDSECLNPCVGDGNYFKHCDETRPDMFLQCEAVTGRCFEMECPGGTVWDDGACVNSAM